MPISLTSPNAFNYYSGGGGVQIQLPSDASPSDAGYVQSFEITPKATILDHFNARTGIRQKDMSIVTEISGELAMTMEEFTARNISLMLMGIETEVTGTATDVTATINIFQLGAQMCHIIFNGFNAAGPQWTVDLPTVQMSPSKALQFISEAKWGAIEMQGAILGTYDSKANVFNFGTATATFPAGSLMAAADTWPKNGNGGPAGNKAMPGRAPGEASGEAVGMGTGHPGETSQGR